MNTSNLSAARTGAVLNPSFGFMKPRASRWVAFGFGAGLAPVMPGTVGTLWAWIAFLLIDSGLRTLFPEALAFNLAWGALLVATFVLGMWACGRTGKDLGVSDHGAMVWDEFVAFWLVLWVLNGAQAGFSTQLGAFFVFRFFDMVKPPPIRYFDRRFKSGFGVMFDDIVAAAFTLLVFAWWRS
jgi:phosphatidylglycerophosphatase A